MKRLKGTYVPKTKKFRIILLGGLLEVESMGMFDNEREMLAYADKNGQPLLAYLDGSEPESYILVYKGEVYDVEIES